MNLTTQQRRVLQWVGYPLLALIVFVFALWHSFNYDRLKGKIVETLSAKYDVSIASIEPSLIPGGIVLESVMLKTRPTKPDEKPVTLLISSLELDVGLFAAMAGNADVDILAKIAGGKIEGSLQYDEDGLEADLKTDMLPLANLPGVAAAVGLPMAGGLNAEMRLKLPKMKWADAKGKIELSCVNCTVGDGKAKLKMKPPEGRRAKSALVQRRLEFAKEGLTMPRLNMGAAVVTIDIEDGVGEIKSFAAKSPDGYLNIEGKVVFADPFKNSTFPGCMTFKFSDDLKKREEKVIGIEAMLPAKARQDDGSFQVPTKGKLAALRWDLRRTCGESSTERPSRPSRPRVTTTPPGERDRPSLGKIGDAAAGRDSEGEEGQPPGSMPPFERPVGSDDVRAAGDRAEDGEDSSGERTDEEDDEEDAETERDEEGEEDEAEEDGESEGEEGEDEGEEGAEEEEGEDSGVEIIE